MTPFEYFARNYVRNSNPERIDMDEWWEDDVNAYRAFMAGADRMLQELRALEIPGLEGMESLLRERFSDFEAYFIAFPTDPDDIFGGGLCVKFGDGKRELLAEVPCPEEYQKQISTMTYSSDIPAMYSMAFRMVQEFHGRSPETVMQLAPLLVDYLLEHHNPHEGIWISFGEVLDFCDRMIEQGQVTLENVPFPFLQSDEEEDNLEWIESDLDPDYELYKEIEDEQERLDEERGNDEPEPPPPHNTDDGLPF